MQHLFLQKIFLRMKETEINQEISKSIKSNIEFTLKLDKSLISGIKIQVGSLLIDTSHK